MNSKSVTLDDIKSTIMCPNNPRDPNPEVIVKSCSRANLVTGFVDHWQRVNVALTRAKKKCIVIGHRGTLETSILWMSYIEFHQKRNAIFKFVEFCELINH